MWKTMKIYRSIDTMILEQWSKKFEMIAYISNNNHFAEQLINKKITDWREEN